MPERPSLPWNETVTFELFQPFALGAGVTTGLADGLVWSILTATCCEFDRPAPFVAEHVKVVPEVSVVSAAGPQPVDEPMPDSASATVQFTDTALRYQPFEPAVPETCGVID